MKYLKKVMVCALVIVLFPVEVVLHTLAGLIVGIGSAFETFLDLMTGEIE